MKRVASCYSRYCMNFASIYLESIRIIIFFFSIRRRHTRWNCDWSSDVCSSDLPSNGDLTPWAERGVLLLNRVLTVQPRQPASHRGKGWEQVTEQAIRALVAREGEPLVAILWGRDARTLVPLLGDVPSIESAHPSPNSAHNGFFGSHPFSRANHLL